MYVIINPAAHGGLQVATVPRRSEQPYAVRLYNGDRMMREEFHGIYCQMPEDYHAELIGGIVFEPSPVSYSHGTRHADLAHWLRTYSIATPETELADNATLILGDEDEVQPDLMLRISDERGGQSRITKDGYIEGAPELVAEIAFSSRAIDLHLKKERYALAGVVEYVVVCLSPKRIYWFDLCSGTESKADSKGVFRSRIFPGLWIHEQGLLDLDPEPTASALERGLKTPAHKRLVATLASNPAQRSGDQV